MLKLFFLIIFHVVASAYGTSGKAPIFSLPNPDEKPKSDQDQLKYGLRLVTPYDLLMFNESATKYYVKESSSSEPEAGKEPIFDEFKQIICKQIPLKLDPAQTSDTETLEKQAGKHELAYRTIVRDSRYCDNVYDTLLPVIRKLNEKEADSDNLRDVSCGPEGREGFMFSFGYYTQDFNPKEGEKPASLPVPVEENSDFTEVFKFCHSQKDEQVIYTEHTIENPELLTLYLLYIQQRKQYKMMTDGHGYFDSRYEMVQAAYKTLNQQNVEQILDKWNRVPPGQDYTEGYGFLVKPQQLVPVDDMGLTLQRKATYHFLNIAPMQDDQIRLWNYMNHLIREDAHKYDKKYNIITGVFNIIPRDKNDKEEMTIEEVDIWIKIVRYNNETSEPGKTNKNEAFAIVMNTALNDENMEEFNNSFCPENICENAFASIRAFSKTRTSVRCCLVTEIAEKFFDQKYRSEASFMIKSFTKFEEMSPEDEKEYLRRIFNFSPKLS